MLARERLIAGLREIQGLNVLPSLVNFLLVRSNCPGWPVARLQEQLARRGLLIRDASNFRGLDPFYFRIAVLRAEHNERLVTTLRDLWAEGR